MAMLGMTDKEERLAIAHMLSLLAEGKSDEETQLAMGLTLDDYERLKKRMYERHAEELIKRPKEHVYIDYMINQMACVRDLQTMVDKFETTKQYNAMVGAIRARSEIFDKLIKYGQDMGVIKKAADRKEIVAGLIIADLSSSELKTKIVGELSNINKMIEKFGDTKITDMEAGPIHRDAARVKMLDMTGTDYSPPEAGKKVKAHSRIKVHGGRKVVKGHKDKE